VIDRFNALHAGRIEVVPVNLPFEKFTTNERKELLARSLRNKSDRIDVFAVDLIWVPRFSKWSQPLGNTIDENLSKNILESALESCSFGDTLVALPLYLDIGMMYYRRDILQKLPLWRDVERKLKESISWDEFIALRNDLQRGNRPFYAFQAKDYEGLVCNYFELLAAQSETQFSKGSFHLDTPEAHRALTMMVQFVKTGVSPREVVDFDENRSYDYMLQHNGVFWRGWPNFLENYGTFYSDTVKIRNIGRAALPHVKGMPVRSVFGGWNLMVSKYSSNKPQAIEFIKFLQREETQKLMFEVGGFLPTNKAIYQDSAYMAKHPDLSYYKTLLDRGFHRPALVEYTRISDIISHFVHRAIKGELSVADALHQAEQMISSTRGMIE
jgi:multiple sugar transport system substrate-binding protein